MRRVVALVAARVQIVEINDETFKEVDDKVEVVEEVVEEAFTDVIGALVLFVCCDLDVADEDADEDEDEDEDAEVPEDVTSPTILTSSSSSILKSCLGTREQPDILTTKNRTKKVSPGSNNRNLEGVSVTKKF